MRYKIMTSQMHWRPGADGDMPSEDTYHKDDYFEEDIPETTFATEAAAMEWLDNNYKGADVEGVTIDYSDSVVEVD